MDLTKLKIARGKSKHSLEMASIIIGVSRSTILKVEHGYIPFSALIREHIEKYINTYLTIKKKGKK